MAQLFRPRSNTAARVSMPAALLVVVLLYWLFVTANESPYLRPSGVPVEQPVLFSHALHAGQLNIDCRYCHDQVEEAYYAGMPSTETCMTCHSQVLPNSPLLAAVRHSYTDNAPLYWNRVHLLSDGVYFHHGIHLQKGVGCETCHGRVDQMPLVWQSAPMTMQWCLDCHRQPEKHLRPRDEVLTFGYQQPENQAALGEQLVEAYHIQVYQLDNCTVCHR